MPRSSCDGMNSCSRHSVYPWQEHPENPRTNSTGSVVCEEDWTTRCTGTKTPHRNTEGRFMETRMPGQHASCKKSSLLSSRQRWSRSFNLVDWVPGDKLGSSRGTHEDLVCNPPSPPISTSFSMDLSWFNYMCTVSSLHTKQYILRFTERIKIHRKDSDSQKGFLPLCTGTINTDVVSLSLEEVPRPVKDQPDLVWEAT